jgi:uracil-DNA glycosylase family 4
MYDETQTWDTIPETTFGTVTECAMCYTTGECYDDGEAFICKACQLRKAPYAECATCPLVAFPCVKSHKPTGTINLVAVGEAPGFYEVQAGKPFVGPSGKLLDAVFEHVGIDPTEVYRTNAVLCRPPDNKLDKYQGAIKACSKRLEAELAALECDTIVALGNSAVQSLDMLSGCTNKDGILKRRGQWYDLEYRSIPGNGHSGRSYLATLHPAFILRSVGYISQFLTDMRSIKLTPSIDWRKIGYTVVNDDTRYAFITELGNWYYDKRMVAFDVETHNLDPKSPLLELGITAYDDEAWIVPGKLLREDESIREIIDHFMQGATLVAHNGKFDQQVLARNGIAQFNLTDDTLLMHYCLDEQKGTHDLKQVASSFLGVHDYESELVDTYFKNMKRTERDYSLIPQDKRHEYLAIDCCATLAHYRNFSQQ